MNLEEKEIQNGEMEMDIDLIQMSDKELESMLIDESKEEEKDNLMEYYNSIEELYDLGGEG